MIITSMGQLASATIRGETEDFLWDGLALVKRGKRGYMNEPHVGGGAPIATDDGVVYFNDMLGSSIAATKGDKTASVGMTSFGDNGSKRAFYTGKPQVEGLGYAFLMRNYRADLGKWQTADPMGYPDSWNQLTYCGNGVTDRVDLWGAYWVNSSIFYKVEYNEWVVIPGSMPLDLPSSVSPSLWAQFWYSLIGVAAEELADIVKEVYEPLWEKYKEYGCEQGATIVDLSDEEAENEMSARGYGDWELVSVDFWTGKPDATQTAEAVQIHHFDVYWVIRMRKWEE